MPSAPERHKTIASAINITPINECWPIPTAVMLRSSKAAPMAYTVTAMARFRVVKRCAPGLIIVRAPWASSAANAVLPAT